MTYRCTIETPLGPMTAAAEDDAIVGLWFDGQKYFPAGAADWSEAPGLPLFDVLREELRRYFSGERNPFPTLPLSWRAAGGSSPGKLALAPKGSDFQKAVWEALLRIPFGKTITYGDIAREVAALFGRASMSAQAVGSAVGHNPISILIPCHRVIGCNGKLTGYAGGLDRKEALLRLEGELSTVEGVLSRATSGSAAR